MLLVPPEPLREAFQAAIQSAQAVGYSDWLADDEAALDYTAARIAPKFVRSLGGSDCETIVHRKALATSLIARALRYGQPLLQEPRNAPGVPLRSEQTSLPLLDR